jgi:hypothetical protein
VLVDVVVCGGGNSVVQVVCVVQTQSTSLVFELLGGEAFKRGLSRDGHEDGEGHRSVGQMEHGGSRLGDLLLCQPMYRYGIGVNHRAFSQQLERERRTGRHLVVVYVKGEPRKDDGGG